MVIIPILLFASIALMLVTGIFWGPWFALHRSLHVFDEAEFIHIVKTLAGNLATPMRVLMPVCLMFLILSVCFYPDTNSVGIYLNFGALAFTTSSLIITLLVEVPLVNQFTQWTTLTIPGNWKAIRDRWVKFHVLRTISSVISFACLIGSVLCLIK